MTRFVTALVLIPAVVWLILGGPRWAFAAGACVVGLLAFREFARIAASIPSKIAGQTAAICAAGFVYIFGSWFLAYRLREINPHWLLFAFLLCWAGDTAALYVGRAFGRHKLAPTVSPGKTWEGAAASLVGGALAGAIYAHYLIPMAALGWTLVLGVAGNVAGQIGDLVESAFKRQGGVKDSGSSLPGHGGWLDRIDSSLFSVPVVYVLLCCVSQ